MRSLEFIAMTLVGRKIFEKILTFQKLIQLNEKILHSTEDNLYF